MTGGSAHSDCKIPAIIGRVRVFHEVLNFGCAKSTRRFKAKSWNAFGQRQIVIDSFRDVYNVNRPAELASVFADSGRTERGIVAADCHEITDAKFRQSINDRAQVGFFFSRVETRHAQDTTARQMNSVDRRRVETDITFFAASEMTETVIHAQNVPAMTIRRVGNGIDNRVDTRRRTAAANYRYNFSYSYHQNFSFQAEKTFNRNFAAAFIFSCRNF